MQKNMENGRTALIIEDEKPLLEAIRAKMEKSGFAVITGRSVKQALMYLDEGIRIDVIWLDHYLIGMESGLDLVAKLKEKGSKYRNIPIYVVSNTATPDKVKSYLRLGISKYFTKADNRLEDIIKDINNFLAEEKE